MNERTKYIDTRFGGNAADSLLQNEIDSLDVEIQAEVERAKKEEKRLDEKIDAETERAVSEEQRIEGKLDDEIARAKSEEERIENKLDEEIARSIAEDERLDQKIDAETDRAQEAERVLDEKIDAETERAEAAEDALDRKIDKEIEDRIIDVDREEAERMAADEALDQKIDKEIQDRIADVDAEEGARIAADAAEAQAREEADTEEAAARVLGDERLQDQINTIEARSDVVDVVSCYDRDDFEEPKPETDLVHYDASALSDNDVVKVLIDETHNDAVSYYRWIVTSASGEPTEGEWVFVGSVEAYYTKAETDAIAADLQEQIDKDIEVIPFQTTTPLTDEQIEKAKAGKLAIHLGGSLFIKYVQYNEGIIEFGCATPANYGNAGGKAPLVVFHSGRIVCLDINTKLLSSFGSNVNSIYAGDSNFIDDTVTPDASGKKIIRETNLRRTQDMLAPVYSSSSTYDAGDYVIYQNDFYKCVSSITVAEAWNPAHWTKSSLSEMLDDIHTATELEILRLFREECTITSNITNGSASGDSTIWTEETASVTVAADSGYNLPETVTVVGASYTYDNTTGVVALSDATGNVTITAACLPPMPAKGDIITLDNGTARYRVLKTNGAVAEVLALDDVAKHDFHSNPNSKTTFSDGSEGLKYENSGLDNYMNSTFYSSLSTNIKNAIVQKNVVQSIYQNNITMEISGYDFIITSLISSVNKVWYKRGGQVEVGNRYCYALDVDDIVEYLGIESKGTVSGADLNEMFFEDTSVVTAKYVWLDSASSNNSNSAFFMYGNTGYLDFINYYYENIVRPAFQVDLTNLAWAKEGAVSKGDIISFDARGTGTNSRFRVIDVDGNEATLLAMDDYTSKFSNSRVTTVFDGGNTGTQYKDSSLDYEMNEAYYGSLLPVVRSAIIDQTRIQRLYTLGEDDSSMTYHQQYDFGSNSWGLKLLDQTTVGSRHVFALDIKDVFDYLGKDTATSAELNEMFFETTDVSSKQMWLSSASSVVYNAYYLNGNRGFLNHTNYSTSLTFRPAFRIDLSQIQYTKE